MIEFFIVLSVVSFVFSLVAIPYFVIKLPYDYFAHEHRPKEKWLKGSGIFNIVKNIVGIVLIIGGILMLVLPGQGVLTILIGLMITDFPGKYKFERWLVKREPVLKTINWIRKRAGKRELLIA